jgi:hypothetical protein
MTFIHDVTALWYSVGQKASTMWITLYIENKDARVTLPLFFDSVSERYNVMCDLARAGAVEHEGMTAMPSSIHLTAIHSPADEITVVVQRNKLSISDVTLFMKGDAA